jgi:hypothetical protein
MTLSSRNISESIFYDNTFKYVPTISTFCWNYITKFRYHCILTFYVMTRILSFLKKLQLCHIKFTVHHDNKSQPFNLIYIYIYIYTYSINTQLFPGFYMLKYSRTPVSAVSVIRGLPWLENINTFTAKDDHGRFKYLHFNLLASTLVDLKFTLRFYIYRVRYYPRFRASAVGLGTYHPRIRGDYCTGIMCDIRDLIR